MHHACAEPPSRQSGWSASFYNDGRIWFHHLMQKAFCLLPAFLRLQYSDQPAEQARRRGGERLIAASQSWYPLPGLTSRVWSQEINNTRCTRSSSRAPQWGRRTEGRDCMSGGSRAAPRLGVGRQWWEGVHQSGRCFSLIMVTGTLSPCLPVTIFQPNNYQHFSQKYDFIWYWILDSKKL